MQIVLNKLKNVDAQDPKHLGELKNATDEYARAARELSFKVDQQSEHNGIDLILRPLP